VFYLKNHANVNFYQDMLEMSLFSSCMAYFMHHFYAAASLSAKNSRNAILNQSFLLIQTHVMMSHGKKFTHSGVLYQHFCASAMR